MPHITLLAYPGCTVSGITGMIDAFAMANKWNEVIDPHKNTAHPLFDWDIVSTDGQQVAGDNRVVVQPHCSIDDIKDSDFIYIPGFLPPLNFVGQLPGEISDWLHHWHDKNVMIGSNCTGTFFLAETGLLDGKTATTNWLFGNYFKKLYPKVNLKIERILTEDSGLLCTGATTSYLNLCLYLIEKFGSEQLSTTCSKVLLMEPSRKSQSPFFFFNYQKKHKDEKILEAQIYMEEKYQEVVSVEALAVKTGISPRHFVRRFKTATGDSPIAYLQRVRIEAAKQKLEKTSESIDEITWYVGYENTNSFRKLFKKNTGLSPKEYRTRFSRGQGPLMVN